METASTWRVEMLGTLKANRNEMEAITRLPTHKTSVLLAYLSYYPERRHVREQLIDMLWPDAEPASGRLRLRVALNTLRRRFEPPSVTPSSVLYADAHWVYFQPGAVKTDVGEFESLLEQAKREGPSADKIAYLMQAVALYQGELLPGYYEDWIQTARTYLAEHFLHALAALALACEAQEAFEHAGEWARRALAADPLRESCHLLLMRLHARTDNVAAALRQYEELAAALKTMQATPSRTACALQEQIRSGKYAPSLATVPPSESRRLPEPESLLPLPSPAANRPQAPLAEDSAESVEKPGEKRIENLRIPRLPTSLTRFYGRSEEIAQIASRLTDPNVRLVTLTGIGGTGKTRLSLETARRLNASFAIVCFVPLADVADASRLPDVVAQALGLSRLPETSPLDQVAALLEARSALLILDNVEQLLPEGADSVHTLLQRLPLLTVLATSRQPLALSGEHEVPVPPLVGPLTLHLSPSEALCFPGMALYVDRAQTAHSGFQITARNTSAIIGLCQRLDGIPLAIELAASWAGTLTPAQMVTRLNKRFDLLVSRRRDVPARHQTLYAAIQWSYDRLEPGIRRFFAQLSVFRGGWTLEAAETVCQEPEAVLYLRQLRERALIVVEEVLSETPEPEGEDSLRYRMLETLREFAQEQLDGEEQAALSQHHARWFLARLTQQDLSLQEQENFRAAHDWARAQPEQEELYLQLVSGLCLFWRTRGWWREGLACLEAALKRNGSAYPALYGNVLRGTASMSRMLNDFEGAMRYYQQAHVLLTEIGDHRGITDVLNGLGCTALDMGNQEAAQRYLNQALLLAQQIQDAGMAASIHGNLGYVAMQQKDWQTAQEHMQQCLLIQRESNAPLAWPLQNLAELAQAQEHWRQARVLYADCLAKYREDGEIYRIAEVLESLYVVLEHCGEPEEAERCRAESQVLSIQLRGV